MLHHTPFVSLLRARACLAAVALLLGACGGVDPAGLADAAAPQDAATADAGPERALAPTDVSVLFPLGPALWPVTTAGRGGPLLPDGVFRQIGRSLVRELPDAAEHAALRVVAFRYDPCFRHEVASTRCQAQVRLVAQALDATSTQALDGAVHLLYHLTPADDAAVLRELRALTALAPRNADAPVGPSPTLVAEGPDGPYGRRLRALVLRVAGAETLQRVTFMTRTSARSGQWEFGGVHVRAWPDGGVAAPGPVAVPLLRGATLQTVVAQVTDGFAYSVTPQIGLPEGVAALGSASIAQAAAGGADAVRPLLAWARGVEDPARQVPDSVDCASCHLANRVGRHIERAHPEAATGLPQPTPRTLGGAERINDNLRAFGYFDAHPAVSQRTANETAAVLAALRAM